MQKPDPSSRSATHSAGHWTHAALFLSFLAMGMLIYFTPLKQWLSQGEWLKEQLTHYGQAAPWIYAGISIILTAVGAPRLLLCSLAGMLFGAVEGILWSQFTTLIGSWGVFVFARHFGARYELKNYEKFSRFTGMIESNGVLAVLVIRQLPMSGFYNNLFLGLTRIHQWEFLLGSFIGFLPLGVTASLIGAGLLQTDLSKSLQYALVGISAALILGMMLKWLRSLATISQPPV
ncbi:MAG: TVP38/TMEM64 family protein [Methylococcaceae bacterium]